MPIPKTTIIVQARHGSTRLPGKVLLDLAGHSVLAQVLHRCQAVRGIDAVCCAVPEAADSDAIAAEAERCGVAVFRGSENDVLDRYLQAAHGLGADVVMRITSDCPLIDPTVCHRVLKLRAERAVDYACNNMPPGWPHGLDCEAFTVEALSRSAGQTIDAGDREHVTPRLRRSAAFSRANLDGPGGRLPAMRWTLDHPADHAFMRELFGLLPPWPVIPEFHEVLRVVDRHPDIAGLNAGHVDRARTLSVKS